MMREYSGPGVSGAVMATARRQEPSGGTTASEGEMDTCELSAARGMA